MYSDPPNADEIIIRIKSAPSIGDIKYIMDEIFPDLFVTTMENYCSDYPHLERNWKGICEMTANRPTQIMILNEVIFDEEHRILKILGECFTRAGFSVKRKREYIPCNKCRKAVPVKGMWEYFKEKGIEVPHEWNPCCQECL
jgi:hypothetical protein